MVVKLLEDEGGSFRFESDLVFSLLIRLLASSPPDV